MTTRHKLTYLYGIKQIDEKWTVLLIMTHLQTQENLFMDPRLQTHFLNISNSNTL